MLHLKLVLYVVMRIAAHRRGHTTPVTSVPFTRRFTPLVLFRSNILDVLRINAQREHASVVTVTPLRQRTLTAEHFCRKAMRPNNRSFNAKRAVPLAVTGTTRACTSPEPTAVGKLVYIFEETRDVFVSRLKAQRTDLNFLFCKHVVNPIPSSRTVIPGAVRHTSCAWG